MTTSPDSPRDSSAFGLEALLARREVGDESEPLRVSSLPYAPDPRLAPPVIVPKPEPEGRPWSMFLAPVALAVLTFGTVALAQTTRPDAPMTLSPSASVLVEPARALAGPSPVWHAPLALGAATEPDAEPSRTAARPSARANARLAARARVPTPSLRHSAPTASSSSASNASSAEAAPADRSLDRLIEDALGDREEPAPTRPPAETLPTTPSRAQVSATLRAYEDRVARCGDGAVTVSLAIEGTTGRVTRARAMGHDDPAVLSCVEDLVEDATFPRFSRGTFQVAFPYRM